VIMQLAMGLLAAGVVCVSPLAASAQSRTLPPPDPGADPELMALNARRLQEASHLAQHSFAMADADADGGLSRAEWRGRSWLRYQAYDVDQNNAIDWAEFEDRGCGGLAEGSDNRRYCSEAKRRQFRQMAGFRPVLARGLIGQRSMLEFDRLDVDRDDYVTRDEERSAPGLPVY
jgi:hypothetical protein